MENEQIFERTVQPAFDVKDRPKPVQQASLSLQHLFAVFGSTVLVSFSIHLPISTALLASGIGTLSYILITRAKIPAHLESSFAFITPIITGLSTHSPGDMPAVLFMSGLIYVIIGIFIELSGTHWLTHLLPSVVVGPVAMVIGLGLAPMAANMATFENSAEMKGCNLSYLIVALTTLAVTIIIQGFFRGFLSLIPVFIGIIVGYIAPTFIGITRSAPIAQAKWIDFPHIYLSFEDYTLSLHLGLIPVMIPVVFVMVSEYIGHQMVINKIAGRNFFESPGLDKSIIGDGVSTMSASMIGGPPSTTYGENTDILAITKIYSIYVIGDAATIIIILVFIGKFTVLIPPIPTPVMGGVSILLSDIIAASGLRMFVEGQIDFTSNRNLVIASIVLVVGVGNLLINLKGIGTSLQTEGMALSAPSGAILNLILPKDKNQIS